MGNEANPEGPTGPSLRGRIAAAIALTVGFYTLAIVITLAMIVGPGAIWAATGNGNLWVTIALAGAGFAVLRSLAPVAEPENPTLPGVALTQESAPAVFEVTKSVTDQLGEPLPADTRLTLEMNASVTELGGGLRRDGRRVMILGLPLLSVLSVDQVRAVIAHEIGHYAGGDTTVGPWVYKTRERIGRTIAALSADDKLSHAIARAPFRWYGKGFLRVTNEISRRQEFAADAVAVKVAGADAHAGALRAISVYSAAYDSFWNDEASPLLNGGRRAPLMHGFGLFLTADRMGEAAARVLEANLEQQTHAYDSHPSLGERLAAVGDDGQADFQPTGDNALSLLPDPLQLETELLKLIAGEEYAKLVETDWEAGPVAVIEENYRATLERNPRLAGLPIEAFGDASTNLVEVGRGMDGVDASIPDEHVAGIGLNGLGMALAIRLLERGFTLEAPPGHPVRARSGEVVVEPFRLVHELATEESRAEARTRLETLSTKE